MHSSLNNYGKAERDFVEDIIRPIVKLISNPWFEDAVFDESNVHYKSYDEIRDRVNTYATIEYTDSQFQKIKKRIISDREFE